MERREHWIWRDRGIPFVALNPFGEIDPKLDMNLFVQFRRSFHLDAARLATGRS
ncbi:MAG: hypothetical protein HYY03_03740 [Chloroflexi bacterium]|nr:hypothetical protein [Chloroflexota bacterium]